MTNFLSLKNQLRTTANDLKSSVNKICSKLAQPTLGCSHFFKDLYNNIKHTQGLLAELWDRAFNKKTVEEELGVKIGDWDRKMFKMVDFLKAHAINNDKLKDLYEEADLVSQMKNFGGEEPIRLNWSYLRTIENFKSIRRQNIRQRNSSSFFSYGGGQYSLVENNTLIYHGETEEIKQPNQLMGFPWETQKRFEPIRDVVYCSQENAYFFATKCYLYRKNIDKNKEKKLIGINKTTKNSIDLKYSKKYNKLFVNSGRQVVVFDLKTSKVELAVEPPSEFSEKDNFIGMILLESRGLGVILISQEGWLVMKHLTQAGGTEVKTRYSEGPRFSPSYGEATVSFCVCNSEKYLLMSMSQSGYEPCYFDLFIIGENSIELKKSIVVQSREAMLPKSSKTLFFEKSSSRGQHLIFTQWLWRRYAVYDDEHWCCDPKNYLGAIHFNFRTGELSLVQTDIDRVVHRSAAE